MEAMEIINSFKKETIYKFSEAIPVFNAELYLIFKADFISIDMKPPETKTDKLKGLIKNHKEETENFISHLDIEPIAYLLKTETDKECNYQIESIDGKYDSFVEKNKKSLLDEFLKNE